MSVRQTGRRRLLWIGVPTNFGEWVVLLLICVFLAALARCCFMCWKNTRDLRGVPQPASSESGSSSSSSGSGSDDDGDEIRVQWKRPTPMAVDGRQDQITPKDLVSTELVLRDDIVTASSITV